MVQPPAPPKPPPGGDQGGYLKSVLNSQLTNEQKVDLLKAWMETDE